MGTHGSEWKTLAVDAHVRLRAIREYAANVLGGDAAAEKWLQRNDLAVRGGTCTVLAACEGLVGFYEAMAELARIGQFRQREARKRASLRERATPIALAPWQGATADAAEGLKPRATGG